MNELVASFKRALRRQPAWLYLRRGVELGWRNELVRRQVVPRILETTAIMTRAVNEKSQSECESFRCI